MNLVCTSEHGHGGTIVFSRIVEVIVIWETDRCAACVRREGENTKGNCDTACMGRLVNCDYLYPPACCEGEREQKEKRKRKDTACMRHRPALLTC